MYQNVFIPYHLNVSYKKVHVPYHKMCMYLIKKSTCTGMNQLVFGGPQRMVPRKKSSTCPLLLAALVTSTPFFSWFYIIGNSSV